MCGGEKSALTDKWERRAFFRSGDGGEPGGFALAFLPGMSVRKATAVPCRLCWSRGGEKGLQNRAAASDVQKCLAFFGRPPLSQSVSTVQTSVLLSVSLRAVSAPLAL